MSCSAPPQININVYLSQLIRSLNSLLLDTETALTAIQDEFNDIPRLLEGVVEDYIN